MKNLNWLETHFPNGKISDAIEIGNELYWSLKIVKSENSEKWHIFGGEICIFSTDDYENIESFLYGFGLAYLVLPDKTFECLVKDVKSFVE